MLRGATATTHAKCTEIRHDVIKLDVLVDLIAPFRNETHTHIYISSAIQGQRKPTTRQTDDRKQDKDHTHTHTHDNTKTARQGEG
jgi:hypothetical protein